MTTDETMAFHNLPGFGWVDPFLKWPPLTRIPTLASATIVMVLLPFFLGAGVIETTALFVAMFMVGCGMAVFVILARGAQADIVAANGDDLVRRLAPSRTSGRWLTVSGFLLGLAALSWFNHALQGNPFVWTLLLMPGYYSPEVAGGIINDWLSTLVIVCGMIVLLHTVAFTTRQVQVFSEHARQVNIDLMHTEDCVVFSQQFLRYLLVVVLLTSLNIIAYEILATVSRGAAAVQVLGPFLVVAMFGCYPLAKPMLVIRDRIAEAKQQEISALREAIAGNRNALAATQIAHVADEFKAPDLMNYEQQIRAIWEWPIQGNVQRLLLYVLLPPLAWVLAALVEQLVDSVL